MRAEFRPLLPARVVAEVTDRACRELHGQTPLDALPEMLFRLARARLGQLVYSISY